MRWRVFWVRRQFYIPTAKRPDTGSVATAVISRWYRMVLSRSACQSIASERSRERSGKFLTACEANIFRVRSSSVGEKLVRNAVRRLEVTVHDDERKWGYGWVSCRTWSERGGGELDYWARCGPRADPYELGAIADADVPPLPYLGTSRPLLGNSASALPGMPLSSRPHVSSIPLGTKASEHHQVRVSRLLVGHKSKTNELYTFYDTGVQRCVHERLRPDNSGNATIANVRSNVQAKPLDARGI